MILSCVSCVSLPSAPTEGIFGPNASQKGAPAPPVLRRLKNGHYRVMENWNVHLNGKRWVVSSGYTSNGITAPSYVKAKLGDGVGSRDTWAAVFHDWLFTQSDVSRAQADRLYFDLMIAYGVSPTKARLMYNTVSAYSFTKSTR